MRACGCRVSVSSSVCLGACSPSARTLSRSRNQAHRYVEAVDSTRGSRPESSSAGRSRGVAGFRTRCPARCRHRDARRAVRRSPGRDRGPAVRVPACPPTVVARAVERVGTGAPSIGVNQYLVRTFVVRRRCAGHGPVRKRDHLTLRRVRDVDVLVPVLVRDGYESPQLGSLRGEHRARGDVFPVDIAQRGVARLPHRAAVGAHAHRTAFGGERGVPAIRTDVVIEPARFHEVPRYDESFDDGQVGRQKQQPSPGISTPSTSAPATARSCGPNSPPAPRRNLYVSAPSPATTNPP